MWKAANCAIGQKLIKYLYICKMCRIFLVFSIINHRNPFRIKVALFMKLPTTTWHFASAAITYFQCFTLTKPTRNVYSAMLSNLFHMLFMFRYTCQCFASDFDSCVWVLSFVFDFYISCLSCFSLHFNRFTYSRCCCCSCHCFIQAFLLVMCLPHTNNVFKYMPIFHVVSRTIHCLFALVYSWFSFVSSFHFMHAD